MVALLALMAAVLGGGAMMLLAKHQAASTTTPKPIKPLHPVRRHSRPAATPVKPRAKTTAKPAVKPTVKPKATAGPTVKPHPKPAAVDGLPAAFSRAFERHSVLVVALYAPNSRVDVLSELEAKAGAKEAGAGFLAVNVTNERETQALTSLLAPAESADRVLDSPAVLVFQRPKNLFVRLNGYNDAPTVAQAAENAIPVVTTSPAQAAWTDAANAACVRMSQHLQSVATKFLANPTDVGALVSQLLGVIDSTVGRLRALPVPAGYQAQVRQMLADYEVAIGKIRQALGAAQHGSRAQAQQLVTGATGPAKQGDHIAYQLGATRCGAA
jgi:hypothetical protein